MQTYTWKHSVLKAVNAQRSTLWNDHQVQQAKDHLVQKGSQRSVELRNMAPGKQQLTQWTSQTLKSFLETFRFPLSLWNWLSLSSFQGPAIHSWLGKLTFTEHSDLKFVWIPAVWKSTVLSSRCENTEAPSVAAHFHLLTTLSPWMKQKWLLCFLAVCCFKEPNSDLFISEEMETSQWWQIYWLNGHHKKNFMQYRLALTTV